MFLTNWLAPRFHRFRERYPDIGVRFTSNIWLDDGGKESDMEIRYGKGQWPGLASDRLSWDELFPVCSPKLTSHQELPNRPDQLSDHTLLHVIGYEEGWGYWLDQTGFTHVKSGHELQFDTLISALEMARQGEGIALGRTSLVKDMMAKQELVSLFEFRVPTSEAFYLVRPEYKYLHPHAEIFRAWIVEEASQEREEVQHMA